MGIACISPTFFSEQSYCQRAPFQRHSHCFMEFSHPMSSPRHRISITGKNVSVDSHSTAAFKPIIFLLRGSPRQFCAPELATSGRNEFRTIKAMDTTCNSLEKAAYLASAEQVGDPDAHLSRLCRNGQLKEAVVALESFARSKLQVSSKTYISLLQLCIDTDSISEGRTIHDRIGVVRDVNPFVQTKLVSMYAKCRSLNDARKVFDEMTERNLFTWSAMIGGYARQQKWEEAVQLFGLMVADRVLPDGLLLPKVVQACGNLGWLKTGKIIHSIAVRNDLLPQLYVSNSILAMYAKCGNLDSARGVFDMMEEKDLVSWNAMISAYCQNGEQGKALNLFNQMEAKGIYPGLVTWNILIGSYTQYGNCDFALELMKKMEESGFAADVFTWTSMISGFAQNNKSIEALHLFREMLSRRVEPNGITLASAISACASLRAYKKGIEVHSVSFKIGCSNNVLVGNALIDMYAKCGKLEAAKKVFDEILDKDVYTYNSMIGGYVQAGHCGKAHELFMKMEDFGIHRNVVTWNVMISGYMRKGDEDQAMELFQKMKKNGVKQSTATWNSLIAGFVQNGHTTKALGIFRQMQAASMQPNSVTILSILPACTNLMMGSKVKEIHALVTRNCLLQNAIGNSLIDAYAKSGNMISAQLMFGILPFQDVISWNSLISCYVLHGKAEYAIHMFHKMVKIGLKPNPITFLSVISAYAIAGMVKEGSNVFSSMTVDYQISPALEHYAAVVDVYGRSGQLKEAENFIEKMPVEPNVSVWNALLTAGKIHGNIRVAIRAAEQIIKLEPANDLMHRTLSHLYVLAGRPNDGINVSRLRRRNVTTDPPDFSLVEVKKGLHTFVKGDQSMLNANAIYSELSSIEEKVKEEVPRSAGPPIRIEEEDVDEDAGPHSEKLAMAFAFLEAPSYQCIRIVKKLRMCVDCHNIAKCTSSLRDREIMVKDSTCLHHFKDGQCSCGDYW